MPGTWMNTWPSALAFPASAAAVALVREAGRAPRICGAHLCIADVAASGVVTEEAKARTGFAVQPDWSILVEAMDAAASIGWNCSATGPPGAPDAGSTSHG